MQPRRGKRFMDLVGGLAMLVLVSPLYLLCVLAVWLAFRRPVHFRQERLGRHGHPFRMYKFRTMIDERDSTGRVLPDEERITLLGRFMRHTSLDELPQLLNIIKGDMSLVGPRPQLAAFTENCSPQERRRFKALPGLTGMAQVSGRNAITWKQKFRLDAWYVDHQSFGLDLMIILRTIPAVLQRRGINKTKPDFSTPTTAGAAAVIEIGAARSAVRQEEPLLPVRAKAAKGSAKG